MTSENLLSWKNNRVYRGKVTKQQMGMKEGSKVVLVSFSVDIHGELSNGFNPKSALLPAPKGEIEITLRFDPDRPDTMGFALGDLEKLGFTDDDLSRLNPNHPNCFSIVGREVHCLPSTKARGSVESTFWNFRFPVERSQDSVAVADMDNSEAATEFRRLMLERKRVTDTVAEGEGAPATAAAEAAATGKKGKKGAAKADIPF